MSAHPHRTALVTGAAKRIGRAIALTLAGRGWALALHYNASGGEARRLADEIRAGGGQAAVFKADLSSEEETALLTPRVVEETGPLAALINNASVFEYDTPETASRESWDLHMQVNLRAPFVLTQAFAALQPKTEKAPGEAPGEANVINIIDQRVWNLTSQFTSYTLSKSALWTLTQTLALALAPRIRVNAIGPGPTLPGARQTEETFRRQWASLPLERRVEPEEIGEAACFILDAPSMTGQMIALDGGQHLGTRQRRDKSEPRE